MQRWWPLAALAGAQFAMVLDQSVMNVSITQLVADFDTTVSTIHRLHSPATCRAGRPRHVGGARRRSPGTRIPWTRIPWTPRRPVPRRSVP